MKSPLRLVVMLACLLAAADLPAQVAVATNSKRVLFLGNSLTAGNDVPALVQAMARLQGVEIDYTALAPGGYAIEDHWSDGHYLLLESGDYDVLILQQGPSTLTDSQINLREWSMTWAAAARQNGTQPALYMIWPVRTQTGGFFLVSQSYRNAATAANAAVFPAGEAWQEVLRLNPSIQLYSGDDLHAMPAGSFLAAMVIARGLVSLDPNRVPATINGITVPAATLATFKSVVAAMPAATLPSSPETTAPTPPPQDGTTGPVVVVTPSVPPTITATPAAAPSAATPSGSGRGGGATSGWFLLALLAASAARMLSRYALGQGGAR